MVGFMLLPKRMNVTAQELDLEHGMHALCEGI